MEPDDHDRSIDQATFQWALDERLRLQVLADDAWDCLDELQSAEMFAENLHEYNLICDAIDLLEISPECAKFGHEFTERIDGISGRGYDLICDRCGQVEHVTI